MRPPLSPFRFVPTGNSDRSHRRASPKPHGASPIQGTLLGVLPLPLPLWSRVSIAVRQSWARGRHSPGWASPGRAVEPFWLMPPARGPLTARLPAWSAPLDVAALSSNEPGECFRHHLNPSPVTRRPPHRVVVSRSSEHGSCSTSNRNSLSSQNRFIPV